MTSLGTLWRTVRHLRREQLVGRLRFAVRPAAPTLRANPPVRAARGRWVIPAMREPSLIDAAQLRLLNVDFDLDRFGWDSSSVEKLLRYNLHYFDDLNARDAAARGAMQRALMARWIHDNPPVAGTGWEPYPVSLRVVNWMKWFMGGATAEPTWVHSLAVQVRWLRRRLESHLLGNHLFANAKALIFAGLFFEGEEADRWLRQGSDIIERELQEQVLADGGHFERSPMYHALALEDVLDLLNIIAARGPAQTATRTLEQMLRARTGSMLYWLRCMSRPDGSPYLFNDSAQGIAPPLQELERYAAALGVVARMPDADGITHLAASGYIRVSRGNATAVLDVAPVGPDYLPAHAHADTLSFEFSIGPQPVIVNGGTSRYGTDQQRMRERGTAAHSTVQVAGADSSEMWSGFRVGRRAQPYSLAVKEWEVCCSHDGYSFLPGRPQHRRCWRFDREELIVADSVLPDRHPAVAHYILAPGLSLQAVSATRWQVLRDEAVIACVEITRGLSSALKVPHAPQFGLLLSVACLKVVLVGGSAGTRWTWRASQDEARSGS